MKAHRDAEKTSETTRRKQAELWRTDIYAVISDMHHCASFSMKEELRDLLTDGLAIHEAKLTEKQRATWEKAIGAIDKVPLNEYTSRLLLQVCEHFVQFLEGARSNLEPIPR